MLDYKRKTYVNPGETVTMEISHSEAAMHLRIAGKVMQVELVKTEYSAVAQVWKDGRTYSSYITTGEAGFYQDDGGYYYYPPV